MLQRRVARDDNDNDDEGEGAVVAARKYYVKRKTERWVVSEEVRLNI
jgi:hypothetical protein